MIYFKACARCRGDMYLEQDSYGKYCKCLQCGHIVDLEMQKLGRGKLAA